MLTLDVAIATNKDGENFVVFPGQPQELVPPQPYDERLSWIQSSFSKFLERVEEIEMLRSTVVVN